MELTKQVTSLPLAQRLKTLGVKQESVFWWTYYPNTDGYALEYDNDETQHSLDCAAFTAGELGEMLPSFVGVPDAIYAFNTISEGEEWIVWYESSFARELTDNIRANTEADARAKCLIFLIENSIISSNDL